jgi:hypothetical protein
MSPTTFGSVAYVDQGRHTGGMNSRLIRSRPNPSPANAGGRMRLARPDVLLTSALRQRLRIGLATVAIALGFAVAGLALGRLAVSWKELPTVNGMLSLGFRQ